MVPCRLWRVMHSWFICWFRCYIHCLLVYLVSPLTSFFLYLFFLTYVLTFLLTFSFDNGPLRFQTRGHKRRLNLGLSCFTLFWLIVFLCFWCMVILYFSKCSYSHYTRFVLYFCGCLSWFWFCFLSTTQEHGGIYFKKMLKSSCIFIT